MENINIAKRLEKAKKELENKDRKEAMNDPLYQIADTVIYLHEETDEFLKKARKKVQYDLSDELHDSFIEQFMCDINNEKDEILIAAYLQALTGCIESIIEKAIIKEDWTIPYKNLINWCQSKIIDIENGEEK
jgi:hypothetical protein